MALNKNALIRYKTIDKCLRNSSKSYTLTDLQEACTLALSEYENKSNPVSIRTIQLDIQNMRSDKFGFNAPIVVFDKKYYTYDDPSYSIMNSPMNELDLDLIRESVQVLKEFKDFSLFSELSGMLNKLEDSVAINSGQQRRVIHLDKNEQLKGLEHLDLLYRSITSETVLMIKYQSFKMKKPSEYIFHPYLLKEFNNRWFLVGLRENIFGFMNIALDRIVSIEPLFSKEFKNVEFDPDRYYADTYGVSVLGNRYIKKVILRVDAQNAPYVLTKPLHASQRLVHKFGDGSVRLSLRVIHNFEFERLILGFGSSIVVEQPRSLRNKMIKRFNEAIENYGKRDFRE